MAIQHEIRLRLGKDVWTGLDNSSGTPVLRIEAGECVLDIQPSGTVADDVDVLAAEALAQAARRYADAARAQLDSTTQQ